MINPLILGPVLELGKSLLDRFFPNEEERRKAEADFLRSMAEGELKGILAQLEVNAREATHPSIWVAGWRPAFGWMGAFGVGYSVVLHPLLSWAATIKGFPLPPEPNVDLLLTISLGILGIGGSLRTVEKIKGASK